VFVEFLVVHQSPLKLGSCFCVGIQIDPGVLNIWDRFPPRSAQRCGIAPAIL
jgi:hypothetical protein